jgi:hypothetical protein
MKTTWKCVRIPLKHLYLFRAPQVFSSKEQDGKVSKTDQAKDLLARYGSAYLITSISFAIVSFGTCYTLVNAGAVARFQL